MSFDVIPYGQHEIIQADIDSVVEVLQSEFLTQGEAVPNFEHVVKSYTGARYGVAVNSATSALHIACLALGLSSGDWLWTSPITFVASANCGLYCGARVDFVDIDPHTYNMSVERLEEKLLRAKKDGQLPKIVIPIHMCGQSCDMAAIYQLSKQYGFKVIEDASHAIGGKYQRGRIGGCQFSDITVFSFHPVKIVTTGEGGMALTNNPKIAQKMTLLRSHGVTRDKSLMTHRPDGEWYYQQIDLGFNYRMTDIQAALGISQFMRLDEYVAKRHVIAARYDKELVGLPVITPRKQPSTYSSFHLYVIRIRLELIGKSYRQVFECLRERGVGVNLHYIPVYSHPYYVNIGYEYDKFPEAERYYASAMSVPIYPVMSEAQQCRVIEALKEVLAK